MMQEEVDRLSQIAKRIAVLDRRKDLQAAKLEQQQRVVQAIEEELTRLRDELPIAEAAVVKKAKEN